MENFSEDREYEERRQRRAERIARMRLEKQRQQRRMRMLKVILPVSLVILVVLSAVSGIGNEADENIQASNSSTQTEREMNVPQTEIAEVVEVTEAPEVTKAPVVYEFVENDATKGIYSEEVISSHAILVDASTDTIVAKKGAYDIISPASMTKVLTVLVAAEHITEGELDDPFTMTLEITDYAYVNDCSSVGFLNEEVVTVRDLFYGTILPSGGDAAVGLATYVAGSHEAFVEMMNEKLEELGLSETAHFTNCVGLYDKEHYCTVYDMAIIMRAAMENEMCREFLSAKKYTTTSTEQHPEGITISNWFLRRIEDKDTGGEVIGAKTGYVVQSKSCAVSYGTFGANETPYICVTAGSNSSWRCIYDQVEIYTRYVPEDAVEVPNSTSDTATEE
ncbi:MAG: D-alanyl-D-alanine carboxypeptidase [Lachnospiraceae bacterium]|nr:D-alanyl-D-alanine carboxypeptidase [Lachnospiraceae bacterium]